MENETKETSPIELIEKDRVKAIRTKRPKFMIKKVITWRWWDLFRWGNSPIKIVIDISEADLAYLNNLDKSIKYKIVPE